MVEATNITTMIDVKIEERKDQEKISREKIEESMKKKKNLRPPNAKKSADRDVLAEKIDIPKMMTDHDG